MNFYKLENGTVINLCLVTSITRTQVYFDGEDGCLITPYDYEELCSLVGVL